MSAAPSSPDSERAAFIEAHHLDLTEVSDAWGSPMFKHSHVDAMWSGWLARASQPATPTGGESVADRLRKDCGAVNGCSCADLNYQWFGPHCEATMTSVLRTMLKDAATPTGGGLDLTKGCPCEQCEKDRARSSAGSDADEFGAWFTKEIDDAKNGLSDCRTEGAGDQYASGYLDALVNVQNAFAILRSPNAAQAACDCGVMCQDLGKEAGCRYLQPARRELRKLVDIVYQHAADSVPMTDTADKLIDQVFGPSVSSIDRGGK